MTVPTTTTLEPEQSVPTLPDIVEEPIDPTADIPGCDTVEEPGERYSSLSVTSGEPSYDDPDFPRFSGPKATAMSNAVVDLLPDAA